MQLAEANSSKEQLRKQMEELRLNLDQTNNDLHTATGSLEQAEHARDVCGLRLLASIPASSHLIDTSLFA